MKRILVFFGGADQYNLSEQIVSAFLKLKRNDIKLDVVVSSNHPHAARIQSQAKPHANITLHGTLSTLAPLILQADPKR